MSDARSSLVGTGQLLRLALRRDRWVIPLWIVGLTALSVGSARATLALYPTYAAAEQGLGGVLTNPAVKALYGRVPTSSLDGLAVFKTVMMGAVLVAVLGFVVVRRHTRTEEDDGRLELLLSGAVGRAAPLVAAVSLASAAVLLTCAASTAGLLGLGMDRAGSVAFGGAWAVAGLSTVGVTAIAAQVASSTRGVAALVLAYLGVAYLLRVAGDLATSDTGHLLAQVSPLGWAGLVQPYGANQIWLIVPAVTVLLLGTAASFVLLDRRDLGSGLLPTRPGPAHGSPLLGSPLGLVFRLTTPALLGWCVGFAVGGAVIGSLAGSVATMTEDPAVRSMLEKLGGSAGTITDIFLATELRFVAGVAAAAGVALALRLAAEERSGRAEEVLSTPVSRTRWYAAHAAFAFGVPALLMVLVAATMRAGWSVVPAALATLPALWVVTAVALALAGTGPRWAPAAWGVLAVAFVVGEVGPTMNLPAWVVDLSPFAHLSHLPGGSFEVPPAAALTALAFAVTVAGWAAYRRRDAV